MLLPKRRFGRSMAVSVVDSTYRDPCGSGSPNLKCLIYTYK